MSDVNLQIPVNQQTQGRKRPIKPSKINTKLPPEQRVWAGNVMKALGLQPRSSQNRIMAGALASAEMVEQTGGPADKLLGRHLRETVVKAGTPPWKGETAMQVGAAKVELDLLSIPANTRKLRPLDPNAQGVNQAFWVDRTDADGQERHSFLCKPAGTPDDVGNPAPSGGPKGGEVAREALAGRAANWMAGEIGIDINMPETHVVELDSSLMGQNAGTPITCSVQEARSTAGDLRGANDQARGQIDPRQIAGIAIFDTLTLNTDRHSGNILLGPDNSMIPIDHGESFAERNDSGIERLGASMGGPHNALLALPGAHEPMPPDMRKKLKAMSPKNYAKALTGDRATVANAHPTMDGAISDGAIDVAQRAARFVQLAAKAEPPMSPAAIQIAMGNAAKVLFAPTIDEQTFERNANTVIQRFAGQGAVVKTVVTSQNAEWEKLAEKCAALGWQVARRGGEPSDDAIADPLMMMKIIKDRVQAPNMRGQRQTLLGQLLTGAPLAPSAAMETMLEVTLAAVDGAIRLVPPNRMRVLAQQKGQARQSTGGEVLPADEQIRRLGGVLKLAVRDAVAAMTQQLDLWKLQSRIDELQADKLLPYNLDAYTNARNFLANGAPEQAKPLYDTVANHIQQNKYIVDAVNATKIRLNDIADGMEVPPTNQILQEGLQALANNDPVLAYQKAEALKMQNRANPCATMVRRLNKLRQDYVIADNDDLLTKLTTAIQEKDVEKAGVQLEMLMTRTTETGAPNAARMRKSATAMGVPNNDNDLRDAQQAAAGNNAAEAKAKWGAVLRRAKAGEFGPNGLQSLQDRLDQLRLTWVIPQDQSSLRRAQDGVTNNNPAKAVVYTEQLEELAASDFFERQ